MDEHIFVRFDGVAFGFVTQDDEGDIVLVLELPNYRKTYRIIEAFDSKRDAVAAIEELAERCGDFMTLKDWFIRRELDDERLFVCLS
jgi:hypothetical protein